MFGINLACHEKLILWLEKINEKRTSSLNDVTPAIIDFFSKHLTELNNQPNWIIGAPIESWQNSALYVSLKVPTNVLSRFCHRGQKAVKICAIVRDIYGDYKRRKRRKQRRKAKFVALQPSELPNNQQTNK